MTREEQIEQQKFVFYESCSDEDVAKSKGFVDGAKWADKTMIEKACKWLKDNIENYYYLEDCVEYFDEMIEDFRKSMEE